MLEISRYLINLLFNTGNAYCKTLRRKAYSDTLKKHLYGILEYAEVESIHPPILCATCEYCPYQQVRSNSLHMVHSHASRLGTSIHPRIGTPLRCIQFLIHLWDRWRRRPSLPCMWCHGCPCWSRPSLGWCSSRLEKIDIECWVDSQVVWNPSKENCLRTCEGLKLERTQKLWSKLAFGGG